MNVAFVESLFATWLRMTDFLSLAICRITASPWWTPTSVCASSRPGPVTAIPLTSSGCASLKVSVAVIAAMDPMIGVGAVGAFGVLSFQCVK